MSEPAEQHAPGRPSSPGSPGTAASPPAGDEQAPADAAPTPPTLLDTLHLVATDAELERQLDSICRLLEHARPGIRGAILVRAGSHLRHGAAPSLPPAYARVVDRHPIGPAAASCGTAAHERTTIVVADTDRDERWAEHRAIARRFDIRASWSEPVLAADGSVLGTVAMQCDRPGAADAAERASLRQAADTVRIVLERDRRRRQLDETRDGLDLALRTGGAALWDWHVPTGRLTVSPGFLEMLGHPETGDAIDFEWLVGRMHAADRDEAVFRMRSQVSDPAGILEAEFRLLGADDRYRWIRSMGRVVGRGVDGSPTRVIGQHVDDTAQRDVVRRERELTDRLLSISRHAPVMFFQLQVDARGRTSIPYVSLAVTELLGFAPEEVMADADVLHRAIHPDDLDGVQAATRRSHARMEPWRHEFRVARPGGGSRWMLAHATPERGPDGSVTWHGFMSDITAQKVLEDRLIAASEAAREASRSKTAFITNLSHELRTPLTSILGFVDLLDQGVVGTDERSRDEALAIIRRNGESLLSVIDDMLDLARLESRGDVVELVPVDPRHIVDEAVEDEAERIRAKGLSLDVVHDTAIPALIATDPGRLRQVLDRLLRNAVNFTPSGRVTVRLAVRAAAAAGGGGHLDGGGDGDDDAGRLLCLSVEDTGIGMTESELERAFDAFSQADESLTRMHAGPGLGLRIAQSLVRVLGGELRATSKKDVGSVFTVSLPLDETLGVDAAPSLAHATAARPGLGDEMRTALRLIAAVDPVSPRELGIGDDDTPCDGEDVPGAA